MAKKQWRRYFRDGDITPRAVAHGMGELFYYMGFHTEYFLLSAARGTRAFFAAGARTFVWVFTALCALIYPFFAAIADDLRAPWRQMRQGLHNLHTVVQMEKQAGSGKAAGTGWQYLKSGVRAYRDLVWNALAYLMPIGAGLIFFFTVHTVLGYTFALAVDYNHGQMKAYIGNETVYDAANEIIRQRLRGASEPEEWAGTAEFKITVVDAAALSSPSELANKIISTSSDRFLDATGVTVDGALVGATQDSRTLQAALDAVKEPYQKPDTAGFSVRFRQDVELVPGLYLTDTLISAQTLVNRLAGAEPFELPSGETITHNCLDVQTVQRVSYVQEIPYQTVTTQSAELEWGEERVQQKGVPGMKNVTANIISMENVEVQREIVGEEILAQPVTEMLLRGARNKYGSGSAGAIGDGQLIWPAPGYIGVSRNASLPYGHRGMDITGSYGTVIVAADNGLVEISRNGAGTYNWSYGLFIKIDHGNGLSTLYGHCSELLVSEGEYVVKGQPIARMGSTGNSTGTHLHFEVARNGVLQMPTNFVTPPHGW